MNKTTYKTIAETTSEQNKNRPKSQEYEAFLEERRSDLLENTINTIWPLIKDEIEQPWTDADKFSAFNSMPTELLEKFDDDFIEFKEQCLNRYYEFLAKKKD